MQEISRIAKVPLLKIVKAAIVDVHGDIGRTQETFSHWAARGLHKLIRESMPTCGKIKVMLPVSQSTMTAPLPIDFEQELFVGYVEDNVKYSISNRTVFYAGDVEIIDEVETCKKCGCNTGACEELYISEEINLIEIDGVVYEEKVVKRMTEDGSYYAEKTTPVKDLETGAITFEASKEVLAHLDIKDCGCLEETDENMETLHDVAPSVHAAYFCECGTNKDYGYEIHEEAGVIALTPDYPYDYLYVEYAGFMPKINGQYYVPTVAFETLVEWTKFKSVQDKTSVPLGERDWKFRNYQRERANMEKLLNRLSLGKIIESMFMIPKFNGVAEEKYCGWYQNFNHRK